ncbi:MAG: PIN domain-containing protein, partial [Acidobacteria bacterium]
VDTSVWIDYFRGSDQRLVEEVGKLLDSDQAALALPVRIEILGGSSKKDLPKLRRALSGLPTFVPGVATWELVEIWVEAAISKGERFGVTDLLIAAVAAEHGMRLWSLDGDFVRMEKLGFFRRYLFEPK